MVFKTHINRDVASKTLVWACRHDYADIVKYLLRGGLELNLVDNHGKSAFIWACENGSVSIVKELKTFKKVNPFFFS